MPSYGMIVKIFKSKIHELFEKIYASALEKILGVAIYTSNDLTPELCQHHLEHKA